MKSSQIEWIVVTDKKSFGLTEEQYKTLKYAASSGKTMVWFDEFVISIPHISYMEKIKKPVETKLPVLPEVQVKDMSKKIADLKRKFNL